MELSDSETIVSINGTLTPPEEANVSVFDRGFLYGDSIYEVVLTYDKVPFLLDEHLARLQRSATGIGMKIQYSSNQIKRYVEEGLEKMEHDRLYIRIIITRGAGKISLDPSQSDGQNLFIIFKTLDQPDSSLYSKGVKLVSTDIIRNSKDNIDPGVKSGNYLNNVLALQEAKAKGGYDAIMLNSLGNVTESSTANIWMVEKGHYITPPLSAGLLGGITRAKIIELGNEANKKMIEEDFNLERLKLASEVFITSSTRELMPVIQVDGAIIGTGAPGPAYRELHTLYLNYAHRKITDSH